MTKSIIKSIIVFITVMLFLGSMAIGVNSDQSVSPDQNVKAAFSGMIPSISASYGGSLFSGQIVSIALNPQPEPPIYRIGVNVGKGIFSGLIVHAAINTQPEPPGALNIKH
jgi:hypothetical protein